MIKNTQQEYGSLSKVLHWLMAIIIFTLFGVGLWMVDLDYYSEWYKTAPHYHKSVGIVLASLLIFRIVWKLINPKVVSLETHAPYEKVAAKITHILLYCLLALIVTSGYLISTADDRAIEVFNWFEIPSLGAFINNQEDVAGDFHRWLAYSLIGLVVIHIIGALKHQFIDKDKTLNRML